MSTTSAITFAIAKNALGHEVKVPLPPKKPARILEAFKGGVASVAHLAPIPLTVSSISSPLANAQTVASQLIQKYAPPTRFAGTSISAQAKLEDGLLQRHATTQELNQVLSAAIGNNRLAVLPGPKQYKLANHIVAAAENSNIVKNALPQLQRVRITTETDFNFVGRPVSLQSLKAERNWLHATKIENDTIAIHADLADAQIHHDPRILQAALAAGLVYKATGDEALANRAAMDIAHKQGDIRLGVLPEAHASSEWLNGTGKQLNGWFSYFDSRVLTAKLNGKGPSPIEQLRSANNAADSEYWNNRPKDAPAP